MADQEGTRVPNPENDCPAQVRWLSFWGTASADACCSDLVYPPQVTSLGQHYFLCSLPGPGGALGMTCANWRTAVPISYPIHARAGDGIMRLPWNTAGACAEADRR